MFKSQLAPWGFKCLCSVMACLEVCVCFVFAFGVVCTCFGGVVLCCFCGFFCLLLFVCFCFSSFTEPKAEFKNKCSFLFNISGPLSCLVERNCYF